MDCIPHRRVALCHLNRKYFFRASWAVMHMSTTARGKPSQHRKPAEFGIITQFQFIEVAINQFPILGGCWVSHRIASDLPKSGTRQGSHVTPAQKKWSKQSFPKYVFYCLKYDTDGHLEDPRWMKMEGVANSWLSQKVLGLRLYGALFLVEIERKLYIKKPVQVAYRKKSTLETMCLQHLFQWPFMIHSFMQSASSHPI